MSILEILLLPVTILPFSGNMIAFEGLVLSENKGLIVFQNYLSVTSLYSNSHKIVSFVS